MGGQEAGLWLAKEHLYFGQIWVFPKLCFWGAHRVGCWAREEDAGSGRRMLGGCRGC